MVELDTTGISYHQASDLLEFESHQLITETSKTTVATLMLLASRAQVTLPQLAAGNVVSVQAVNARGLEGWDWAKTTVGELNVTRITQ